MKADEAVSDASNGVYIRDSPQAIRRNYRRHSPYTANKTAVKSCRIFHFLQCAPPKSGHVRSTFRLVGLKSV